MQKKFLVYGLAAVMALAVACSDNTKTPVSPSVTLTSGSEAAADGSTLKVAVPVQQLPANGTTVDTLTPNLVLANASGRFVNVGTLVYRYELQTEAGAAVYTSGQVEAGASLTGHRVPVTVTLEHDTAYRWRVRAEQGTLVGPWSGFWTFRTLERPKAPTEFPSFQNATELWDLLTDGKTIGTATNAVFVPGRGVRLPDFSSHVTYTLQNTLTEGEMSFYVGNIDQDTNGGKTKVVSMQQGYGDFTANKYRFNVEKRGDDHPDAGKFRMRIITGNSESFYDSDRYLAPLVRTKNYFFTVTWGNGIVRHVVQETNDKGPVVAQYTMTYKGTYRPSPHVVHLGVTVPRGGEGDATVPGIEIWQFYVSAPGGKRPGSGTTTLLPEFGFATPGGNQ